jgi:RimJ/RimL family protein N-acetyltransferase
MLPRGWLPDQLVGRTVVLRPHTPENLAAFRRWYADPEIARLTRYQDGPMRRDEIDRFFQIRAVGTQSLAMAIHIRESGRLIGSCAFSAMDPDNGAAMFHITLGEKDCWGRGYGSEATELMLDHAFGTLGLHRVALAVFSFNERAIRSYRKVGFVVEGRSRQAIFRDGRFWDELHMSVLADEWRARAPSEPVPVSADGATPAAAGIGGGDAAPVDLAAAAPPAQHPGDAGERRSRGVLGRLGRR